MKHSVALVLTLASGIALSAAAQTPPATTATAPAGPAKIAVVAFQVAVAQTNEGQRNFADLQKKYEPKRAQLKTLSETGQRLRDETGALVTALRKPNARGQWGQMQLRNVVELAGMAAGAFEQHVEGAAETAAIKPGLATVDHILQKLQALRLGAVVDLIVHLGAGSSGPRRIFERERAGKPDLPDQIKRGGEIARRFARETDDEIGRQRQIRSRRAQASDDVEIVRAGVTAIHGRENAVGTRLHRQMQLRHELWQIAMRRY